MNNIKNRARKLKNHFKRNMEARLVSRKNLFKKRSREIYEQKTNMEMWENYLNFTRLEF